MLINASPGECGQNTANANYDGDDAYEPVLITRDPKISTESKDSNTGGIENATGDQEQTPGKKVFQQHANDDDDREKGANDQHLFCNSRYKKLKVLELLQRGIGRRKEKQCRDPAGKTNAGNKYASEIDALFMLRDDRLFHRIYAAPKSSL